MDNDADQSPDQSGDNPRRNEGRYYGRGRGGSRQDEYDDYGPPMTAAQHEHRLRNMEIDQLRREVQECRERVARLEQEDGNMQRGRSASGRFTSGPGRAGSPNRSSEYDYERSGYPPRHMHPMDGYTGPEVPYYPPPNNMQHWGGGGYGRMPYYDPFLRDVMLMQALGSLQYGGPIAMN